MQVTKGGGGGGKGNVSLTIASLRAMCKCTALNTMFITLTTQNVWALFTFSISLNTPTSLLCAVQFIREVAEWGIHRRWSAPIQIAHLLTGQHHRCTLLMTPESWSLTQQDSPSIHLKKDSCVLCCCFHSLRSSQQKLSVIRQTGILSLDYVNRIKYGKRIASMH